MFLLESKSAAFADARVPHTRGEKGLDGNGISREGQAGATRHTARGGCNEDSLPAEKPLNSVIDCR